MDSENTNGNTLWKKGGPSPNPGGRPKGAAGLRRRLMKHRRAFDEALLEALKVPKTRVQAVALAWAYMYGKPTQQVNVKATVKAPPAQRPLQERVDAVLAVLVEIGQLPPAVLDVVAKAKEVEGERVQ